MQSLAHCWAIRLNRERELTRPSAIVLGPQRLPEGAAPPQGDRRTSPAMDRCAKGEGGDEVSGSTRGAGTAVTAGEVPQLKVVSGRHLGSTRLSRKFFRNLGLRRKAKHSQKVGHFLGPKNLRTNLLPAEEKFGRKWLTRTFFWRFQADSAVSKPVFRGYPSDLEKKVLHSAALPRAS